MFNKTSKGLIQTTVLITPEFNELRKKHRITLSEAVRVGISLILSERGVKEYDNNLNISKRMNKIVNTLSEKCKELEDLKNKSESKIIKSPKTDTIENA